MHNLYRRWNVKKVLLFVITGLIVLSVAGCGAAAQQTPGSPEVKESPSATDIGETPESSNIPGYQNSSYEIEGKTVNLVNGVSEIEAAPGSAAKIVTRYFGNEVFGDLNGDGKEDAAFLITQDGGGSGTFFYVVAALQNEGGYQGTNAILLGDRIAPQSTQIENGSIVVNYAVRKPGEPFSAQPSVGTTKQVTLMEGKLVEGLVVSPSMTIPNIAAPAKDIVISKNIDEISSLAEWTIKSPGWLPEGYQFNEATYDPANQMVNLTFVATRPLPGNDPSLTQTSTITLAQSLRNDLIPLIVAPGVDMGSITINGSPAAYAIGAWKNDNATGTATWDNSYQLQNINWQIGSTYLSLNTNDTLVSKDDLLKIAEGTK